MAWFRNHYDCDRCGRDWTDEWSATCDDDCPHCGARHMSPSASENLTKIVYWRRDKVVLLVSPDTAEHFPDYKEIAVFPIGLVD